MNARRLTATCFAGSLLATLAVAADPPFDAAASEPSEAAAAGTRCGPWELVNPYPQPRDLRAVAWGDGRWVAVGDEVAVTSLDGVQWSAASLPGARLHGIAWGEGAFVAVGAGGAVLTSADGSNWARGEGGTSLDLAALAFDAGTFVAVGNGPSAMVSADRGLTWTAEALPVAPHAPHARVAVLVGIRVIDSFAALPGERAPLMVAWGAYADGGSALLVRTGDGAWRPIPDVPESPVSTVWASGGAIYLSAGGALRAWVNRGSQWEATPFGDPSADLAPHAVVGSAGGWVAIRRGLDEVWIPGTHTTIYRSDDGAVWHRSATVWADLAAVSAASERFVAVGAYGTSWTSEDGRSWASSSGFAQDVERIEWNGHAFIAELEAGTLQISSDGQAWTDTGWPLALAAPAPGRFVTLLAWSADGFDWSVPETTGGGSKLVDGAWANGRYTLFAVDPPCPFLCPSPLYRYSSSDLVDWQVQVVGPPFLARVTSRGDLLIGTAGTDSVWTSADGETWEPHAAPGDPLGPALAAGPARVVVSGTSPGGMPALFSSSDLATWQEAGLAGMSIDWLTWTGAEFLGVGEKDGFAAIVTTRDGTRPEVTVLPFQGRLRAAAGTPRVELVGGDGGVVLRRICDRAGRTVRHRAVR